MRGKILILSLVTIFTFSGCGDDEPNLPTVDERKAEALAELRAELLAPTNGWLLRYRPTPESGVFLVLMNFDENGEVRIQSDVPANDGEFYDHTITYRLDAGLSLELILETYGVFHFLFELDQASFGAEFEFLYNEKSNNNLIFESKTDIGDPTELIFEPATADAASIFARDIATNMEEYGGFTPVINFFGTGTPFLRQQLYIENSDVSVFWAIDVEKRLIIADVAGEGADIGEVNTNGRTVLNQVTGYTYQDGAMVMDQTLSFSAGGEQFEISRINLTDLDPNAGLEFCGTSTEATPTYTGSISGLGPVTLFQSLYALEGERIQPRSDAPYSINVVFIFDEEINSLSEEGSIAENFPTATGFVFNYGFTDDEVPAYSAGLILEKPDESTKTYLREFEPTTTVGNQVTVNFTDDFYFSEAPAIGEEQALREVMDEIFAGQNVYAFYFEIQGIDIIRMYNPCNNYEFLLVD